MPASSANLINSALHSALNKKGTGGSRDTKSDLEDQLNASSKQIFLHDIEYEASSAPQSFVLNNLRAKYVNVISKGKKNHLDTFCPKLQKTKMAHGRTEDKLEDPRVTLWPSDKVVLGWRKSFPPGAGMINLGNTCYMNSSLQALFHIPSLVNWLLEEISTHIPSCEANTQNASFCSICGMMRTLKLALDRGNNVIKPSFIHSKLKSIGKTLMYGRQEDAHEFIKLLLDHMEKSFLQYKRATKLDHRSKETTPLNQIFGGYLRQQVICPLCCYVSTTFSHFQDLVLDIRSVGSVDEALNLYFRKETLDSDNAYKCEKCHKKVPATKRHLIERAPHVLLLQLKRFTISGGKITKHVNIQKTIDISKYVNGVKPTQPNGTGPYFYRLVSMVIHIGSSQHGGHYTAIAEASNNTMFEFDDASVRPIPVHSALLRNPYILFYEMVRKPKAAVGPKPVIRQNSEKSLLRQSSSDKIAKPFPASLSASCMWNGAESLSDNIGEAVSRNGLAVESIKSPIPNHKERERVSFSIKKCQDSSGTKLSSKSTPSQNGTYSKSYLSSCSVPTSSHAKNGLTASSLVPYNDDSDDSENGKEMNGRHTNKCRENGHLQLSEKLNGREKDNSAGNTTSFEGIKSKSVKSNIFNTDISKNKNVASNSEESKSNKGAKIGYKEESRNGKISDEQDSNSGPSKNSIKKTQFLPRSLQVVNGRDSSPSSNKLINNHSKLVNNTCDKQVEKDCKGVNPQRATKELSLNNSSKFKSENNGWIISDNNERSPSESSTCSSSSSQGFLVTEKHKKSNKEKDSYNGWTVTKRDSENPSSKRQTPDKSETASLKSKESLDSNRSDKSTKSMKKSFFSLFPCVSSSHSPDLSPEDEQTNSVIENTISSPVTTTDPKRSANVEHPTNCGASAEENSASDDDSFHLKRNRDHEEHEPASPFKKCRPEERLNLPAVVDRLEQESIEEPKTATKRSVSPPLHDSILNGNKNERNLSTTRDEENFSMEEKKSRHKRKNKSDFPLTNGTHSDAKEMGSRLNANVVPVEWNRHLNDLSHNTEQKNKIKNHCFRDGNDDLSVVNTLKKAGQLPFGVKVNTWEGEESRLTQQIPKGFKKRTLDDIYDEEIDKGKTMKKRHKILDYKDLDNRKENPFQKFQTNFINRTNSFGRPRDEANPKNFYHKLNRYHSWNDSNFYAQSHYYRGNSFNRNYWHKKSDNFHKDKFYNRKKFRLKEFNRY